MFYNRAISQVTSGLSMSDASVINDMQGAVEGLQLLYVAFPTSEYASYLATAEQELGYFRMEEPMLPSAEDVELLKAFCYLSTD